MSVQGMMAEWWVWEIGGYVRSERSDELSKKNSDVVPLT